MRSPDWPALLGNACAVVLGLTWLYWMILLASRAAWSHQAHAQALLEGFR